MDTVFVTLSLTVVKHSNGSRRCPPSCRSRSGGDSVAIGIYNLPLHPPPYAHPHPFTPSLISIMVSVDVKHHVYLVTSSLRPVVLFSAVFVPCTIIQQQQTILDRCQLIQPGWKAVLVVVVMTMAKSSASNISTQPPLRNRSTPWSRTRNSAGR